MNIPSNLDIIKKRRTPILAACAALMFFLGQIYAFSMFASPIVNTFLLDRAAVAITFNIIMICFCLGGLISAPIIKKLSIRATLFIAGIVFFCGFTITATLGHLGIGSIYLGLGVISGLGCGIGYNTIVTTCNLWFPDKPGFCSGVLMMAFSLSALLLGTLAVSLMGTYGLPVVFMGIASLSLFAAVIAGFFLKRPPATHVASNNAEGAASNSAPKSQAASAKITEVCQKPWAMPIFWIYFAWCVLTQATGVVVIGNVAADSQLLGINAAIATTLVGVVALCNGLARIVFGMIFDKTSQATVMTIGSALAICACILIFAGFFTGITACYLVGIFMCVFSYGACPVLSSTFARTEFNIQDFPRNLAMINLSVAVASFSGIIVQTALANHEAGRIVVYITFGAFAICGALLLLPFKRQHKNKA